MATKMQMPHSGGIHNQRQTTKMMALETDREKIPLVGHIITDEDIGALQGARLQPINLNKVVKLLTDPHSAVLYDRHMHALRKVIKHYEKGFIMKDLVAVFKMLNVCADRIEEHPIYIEPMISVLKICSLPYLKEKSSDELTYEQIAVESVAQLGYLMRVPAKEVRLQICDTLVAFYCEKPPAQNVQGHKANNQSYNRKIIEKSDVSETLTKSLSLLEADTDVKIRVLDMLQRLTKKSGSNCDQILNANGAERLCSRMMDYDPSGQILFRSVDILWNLLEQGDINDVTEQLNRIVCIRQLQDAFIQQLTKGYSHYDRQLRNDLLVISSIVAENCVEAPFLETGFVKQLTLFATFQEVKSHSALVKHLKLLPNPEDFELKKLIINILVLLSKDSAVIPVLSEGKLLLALFSFVKANEKVSQPREWTVAQAEELQLHAMAALATLCPLMIDEYMTCQGSTRLLLLLEWCVGPDDYAGTGNSFHGAGGRSNKKAQMRYCLRLMRSMVSTGNASILQDFTDQGAINQLTSILSMIVNNRKPVEHEVDVEMQCDMLFVLSCLCENDMHRKELFGNSGGDVVVEYLRTNTSLLSSGLGHHKLLLAAVDAVWCCIVGCYLCEDYFLEKEGVFLLLDLLENCPRNMHNLILGCLLDLTENPKTVSHINAWRGIKDISGAHLFCNIFRQEEKDMNVQREDNGALADPKRPLMGEIQESQGVIPLPSNCPSQAIVDVVENLRAKIYAIFCKLGFVELPGLTTEDHVTLTIVEHYLDFKLGEVWHEVIEELNQEGIRPTTPDREALEAISRTIDDRTDHVLAVQRELLEAQDQQDKIDEQEHYAEIRENHRQKEKAIRDFQDYVARTSNYMLLKAAKERQELSIDASRVQTNYTKKDNFHTTEMKTLNTTIGCTCGKSLDTSCRATHGSSTNSQQWGTTVSWKTQNGDGPSVVSGSGKYPSCGYSSDDGNYPGMSDYAGAASCKATMGSNTTIFSRVTWDTTSVRCNTCKNFVDEAMCDYCMRYGFDGVGGESKDTSCHATQASGTTYVGDDMTLPSFSAAEFSLYSFDDRNHCENDEKLSNGPSSQFSGSMSIPNSNSSTSYEMSAYEQENSPGDTNSCTLTYTVKNEDVDEINTQQIDMVDLFATEKDKLQSKNKSNLKNKSKQANSNQVSGCCCPVNTPSDTCLKFEDMERFAKAASESIKKSIAIMKTKQYYSPNSNSSNCCGIVSTLVDINNNIINTGKNSSNNNSSRGRNAENYSEGDCDVDDLTRDSEVVNDLLTGVAFEGVDSNNNNNEKNDLQTGEDSKDVNSNNNNNGKDDFSTLTTNGCKSKKKNSLNFKTKMFRYLPENTKYEPSKNKKDESQHKTMSKYMIHGKKNDVMDNKDEPDILESFIIEKDLDTGGLVAVGKLNSEHVYFDKISDNVRDLNSVYLNGVSENESNSDSGDLHKAPEIKSNSLTGIYHAQGTGKPEGKTKSGENHIKCIEEAWKLEEKTQSGESHIKCSSCDAICSCKSSLSGLCDKFNNLKSKSEDHDCVCDSDSINLRFAARESNQNTEEPLPSTTSFSSNYLREYANEGNEYANEAFGEEVPTRDSFDCVKLFDVEEELSDDDDYLDAENMSLNNLLDIPHNSEMPYENSIPRVTALTCLEIITEDDNQV